MTKIANMVKDATAGFCPFCKKDMTDAKFSVGYGGIAKSVLDCEMIEIKIKESK